MRLVVFLSVRARRLFVAIALLTFLLAISFPSASIQPAAAHSFQGKSALAAAKEEPIAIDARRSEQAEVSQGEPSTLLEQGKALFTEGRLAEAAAAWGQAAQHYAAQGNQLGQARSLNYLALAYFNLGQWEQAERTIRESLSLAPTAEGVTPDTTHLWAASLNTQGNIQLVLGQTETALETWRQAAIAYESVADMTGKLGSQLNQARALQILGRLRRSRLLLEEVLTQIQSQSDTALKATGLRLLGATLQTVGDLAQSRQVLEQSLAITKELEAAAPVFAEQSSTTLVSLGNTLAALQETDRALERYQQAAAIAPHPLSHTEALLNQLRLLADSRRWPEAQPLLPQIYAHLADLAPSRASVFARVNFADSLIKLEAENLVDHGTRAHHDREPQSLSTSASLDLSVDASSLTSPHTIAQLLATAVQQARTLSDQRAEAYALGELGHLYEVSSQWRQAQGLTEQAIHLAEEINGVDIEAPWQWQLGRILKQQGKTADAIATYTDAVHSLQFLRQELVTLNPDFQFSFTEKVEPVYRELVSLVLAQNPDQANLQTARELIQDLQYAELYNYFREPCLQATPQSIDGVDAKAAVIYPIILSDRLVVIASMAGHPLFSYETRLPQSEIEATIDQLQLYLNPHFFDEDRLSLSQQLYDWLIRPAEAALADNHIQTLVFVLDGSLRSLPMAALYDGQQYLIEKYNVALNPGLQLLEPRSLEPGQLKTLTAGLSQSHRGFTALPAVEVEVNQIAQQVPSTVLLNQEFTSEQLRTVIDSAPFPVVHLATHGRYGAEVEDTFLVTWDSQINVRQLDELLRARERDIAHPLELLVLSACQTATGDKRAALGLAGFAIRSGARSTLATLWQVNDDSTAQLMVAFYQQLTQHPGVTKAEALRRGQLQLLRQSAYQHPFYWAPFVLIGNWL